MQTATTEPTPPRAWDMKESIQWKLTDANEAAHEYYRDGDGTDSYNCLFSSDIDNVHYCNDTARNWLLTAGDGGRAAHYNYRRVTDAAIDLYRRWLAEREPDQLAEPEFSSNEYYQSKYALTGYELPEYDQTGLELDKNKHARIIAAVMSSNEATTENNENGGAVLLFLSGQIEYIATDYHRRAARLILRLSGYFESTDYQL